MVSGTCVCYCHCVISNQVEFCLLSKVWNLNSPFSSQTKSSILIASFDIIWISMYAWFIEEMTQMMNWKNLDEPSLKCHGLWKQAPGNVLHYGHLEFSCLWIVQNNLNLSIHRGVLSTLVEEQRKLGSFGPGKQKGLLLWTLSRHVRSRSCCFSTRKFLLVWSARPISPSITVLSPFARALGDCSCFCLALWLLCVCVNTDLKFHVDSSATPGIVEPQFFLNELSNKSHRYLELGQDLKDAAFRAKDLEVWREP